MRRPEPSRRDPRRGQIDYYPDPARVIYEPGPPRPISPPDDLYFRILPPPDWEQALAYRKKFTRRERILRARAARLAEEKSQHG